MAGLCVLAQAGLAVAPLGWPMIELGCATTHRCEMRGLGRRRWGARERELRRVRRGTRRMVLDRRGAHEVAVL